MTQPLVLASSSVYRQRQLARLGVPFSAADHRADESSSGVRALPVRERPAHLARAKADSLRAAHPGAFVLGSDQLVILGDDALGKPGTAEAAAAQLRQLSGRTHELWTAVCLLAPGGQAEVRTSVHRLAMRPLTDGEIERYLATDAPLDCCGSYKIESLGISLFERIDGDDFTAIEGLPLMATAALLRAAGFAVP